MPGPWPIAGDTEIKDRLCLWGARKLCPSYKVSHCFSDHTFRAVPPVRPYQIVLLLFSLVHASVYETPSPGCPQMSPCQHLQHWTPTPSPRTCFSSREVPWEWWNLGPPFFGLSHSVSLFKSPILKFCWFCHGYLSYPATSTVTSSVPATIIWWLPKLPKWPPGTPACSSPIHCPHSSKCDLSKMNIWLSRLAA